MNIQSMKFQSIHPQSIELSSSYFSSFKPYLKYLRWILIGSILIGGVIHPSFAKKQTKKKAKNRVTSSIKPFRWGISLDEVKKHLTQEIKKSSMDEIQGARDDLEIDRIRSQMKERIRRMDEGYIEFRGQRTGYEISMIKNDFMHQDQESMLKVDEGGQQRYYFFKGNQLWKIIFSYPSYSMKSFTGFVRTIRRKMGKPLKLDIVGKGEDKSIQSAVWKDEATLLTVEDQSEDYQKFTIKYLSIGQGESIEAKLKAHQLEQANKQPEKRRNKIDIFGEDESEDNVVDKITGSESKVDLSKKYRID